VSAFVALLELHGVSKRFRRGGEVINALDTVDLSLEAGEFLALVGPSGSGKSTLLHVAGGLDLPDTGRILLGGRDIATLSPGDRAEVRRRQVGFIFQFFHLIPTLTVAENVELPLVLDGARRRNDGSSAVLERVGIAHRASHLPGELSGGELQRAAIARALVHHPQLILADEPTGNLDSQTAADVMRVLLEQVRDAGAALLMVTHAPDLAASADRVITLRDGHLSAEPATTKAAPARTRRAPAKVATARKR